jgi:hypothetical protein
MVLAGSGTGHVHGSSPQTAQGLVHAARKREMINKGNLYSFIIIAFEFVFGIGLV